VVDLLNEGVLNHTTGALTMSDERLLPSRRLEREVLAEGQEWMKRRMEERLRELAEKEGEVFPPEAAKIDPPPADSSATDDDVRRGEC
jgi:hypothetical protein